MLNKFRDPISGLTHLAAAIGAMCGVVILMLIGHDDATKAISLAIYGFGLVLMFAWCCGIIIYAGYTILTSRGNPEQLRIQT